MKTQSRFVTAFIALAVFASIWPRTPLPQAIPLRLPATTVLAHSRRSPSTIAPEPKLNQSIPRPFVHPPAAAQSQLAAAQTESHPNYLYTALLANTSPLYPM